MQKKHWDWRVPTAGICFQERRNVTELGSAIPQFPNIWRVSQIENGNQSKNTLKHVSIEPVSFFSNPRLFISLFMSSPGYFDLIFLNHFSLLTSQHVQLSGPNQVPNGGWDHAAFATAEAQDLLRRSESRALSAPEGWHLDRGEEDLDVLGGRCWGNEPTIV